jgi:hypothetical protein
LCIRPRNLLPPPLPIKSIFGKPWKKLCYMCG